MPPKRKRLTLAEDLERPFCYYCGNDFEDDRVLLDHMKRKHLVCPERECNKRFDTPGGLVTHARNVHKETVTRIPHALPGREGVEPEIFGMIGVPEDIVQRRRDAIIREHREFEAEHRRRTGNPLPGTPEALAMAERARNPPPPESSEDRKARVMAHIAKMKAKKEAEALAKTTGQQQQQPMATTPSYPSTSTPSNYGMPTYSTTPPAAAYGYPMPPTTYSSATPITTNLYPQTNTYTAMPTNNYHNSMPNNAYAAPNPYTTMPPNSYSPSPTTFNTLSGFGRPAMGLPSRPTSGPPRVSDETMAQLHPRQVQSDGIDDLIAEVTGQRNNSNNVKNETPTPSTEQRSNNIVKNEAPTTNTEQIPSKPAAKQAAQRPVVPPGVRLAYQEQPLTPEEVRYHRRFVRTVSFT